MKSSSSSSSSSRAQYNQVSISRSSTTNETNDNETNDNEEDHHPQRQQLQQGRKSVPSSYTNHTAPIIQHQPLTKSVSNRHGHRHCLFKTKDSSRYYSDDDDDDNDDDKHKNDKDSSQSSSTEDIDGSSALYCRSSTEQRHPFPVTWWTYIYALCAALNSVNLGYDLGVSTNVGPLVQDDFDLSTEQLELFLGSLNFWSIGGALISPVLSDSCGRRTTLRTAAFGFIVGVGVCAMAPTFEVLMVGRMIVGIGVGVGEAIDPMYIAEIAPAHIRGELVSWAEAGVAVGVVLGFASSLLGVGWRTMLALGTLLPLVMLVLATFVLPESPRWLVAHHQEAMARAILERIYPTDQMVDDCVKDMKDSLELERMANQSVGWMALFKPCPAIRRMLIVGIGIACIQQACGIDSIMFYLLFVLKQSGVESNLGQDWALIALGTVKLAFVFVGARNFDHSGRRVMLFLSLGGMTISLLVVSFTFTNTSSAMKLLTVVALSFYLAFFSIGLGPGNWVVVSEIFAPSIRAKAMMLAVLPNRLTATFMASTFLSVAHAITWPGFFLLLAGICLASLVFLYCLLPETKGKTLEDMVRYFAQVTGDQSILQLEQELRDRKEQHECDDDHHHEEVEMGARQPMTMATPNDSSQPLEEDEDCIVDHTRPLT